MQRPDEGPERGAAILTSLVPLEQWSHYAPLFAEGERRGIRFAIGGGLAVSAYSGSTRYTKDMDLFVAEAQRGALLEMLRELGFGEYTEFPYDRTWSYRSIRDGAIVDVLWRTLNGKAAVGEPWLSRGWQMTVRETPVRLIPLEELIMTKLYILKRDRTDWPDILSLLQTRAGEIQWPHLLEILGEDRLLLGGVLCVFCWLCPGRARHLPEQLWQSLGLLPPERSDLLVDMQRVALLAARQWLPGAAP